MSSKSKTPSSLSRARSQHYNYKHSLYNVHHQNMEIEKLPLPNSSTSHFRFQMPHLYFVNVFPLLSPVSHYYYFLIHRKIHNNRDEGGGADGEEWNLVDLRSKHRDLIVGIGERVWYCALLHLAQASRESVVVSLARSLCPLLFSITRPVAPSHFCNSDRHPVHLPHLQPRTM